MKRRTILGLLLTSVVLMAGCAAPPPISESTIFVVTMGPADMLAQLKSGDIDGFIAWEPFNAEAVLSGDGKYLIQSSEAWPDHPCCVLAYASQYEDEIVLRAIAWAHIQATRFLNDPANQEQVIRYAMDFTGKDREVVVEALQHIEFIEYPNRQAFKTYFQKLNQFDILTNLPQDLGFASEEEFFDDFLFRRYFDDVRAALDADPRWKPDLVPSDTVVRIGYLLADLHEIAIYVAQQEGYFQEVGLIPGENLIVMPPYANGVAVMEAFKNGDIDLSYLGSAPATLKRINDKTPIRVLAGANNVGSAIVVRSDSGIDSLEGLAGKTIATPGFGTVQDTLLRMVAEQVGLTIQLK
ncbi:MAG: ABC transporter substrate-binding protein [Anaerolineae bacterium]